MNFGGKEAFVESIGDSCEVESVLRSPDNGPWREKFEGAATCLFGGPELPYPPSCVLACICGVNWHSIVSIGFSCEVEVVSRSSAALLGSIVEARRMMLWPFSSSEVGVGTEPV
jgi:hypothetical protein